jgi:hypothetical protein
LPNKNDWAKEPHIKTLQCFIFKKPITFFYVTMVLRLFLFASLIVSVAGYIWMLMVMFHLSIETSHQMLFWRSISFISLQRTIN